MLSQGFSEQIYEIFKFLPGQFCLGPKEGTHPHYTHSRVLDYIICVFRIFTQHVCIPRVFCTNVFACYFTASPLNPPSRGETRSTVPNSAVKVRYMKRFINHLGSFCLNLPKFDIAGFKGFSLSLSLSVSLSADVHKNSSCFPHKVVFFCCAILTDTSISQVFTTNLAHSSSSKKHMY